MKFSSSRVYQCLIISVWMLSCGQVSAQCADEIAKLTKSRTDAHWALIDKMRADFHATDQDWRNRVLLHLDNMSESYHHQLDSETDRLSQQKILNDYRIKRDAYFFEESSRNNRERSEINIRTRDSRDQVEASYLDAVQALKNSERCSGASREVLSEMPELAQENGDPQNDWGSGFSARLDSGLEDPAEMNQAVRDFRKTQELKKKQVEVAKNIDVYQIERGEKIRNLEIVESNMIEIYGKTGLGPAKDRIKKWFNERKLSMARPEYDMILEELPKERKTGPILKELNSYALGEAYKLRNDGFKESLKIIFEETLVDDKIRLIESHEQLTQRIDELDLLIDEGNLRLKTIDSEVGGP